MPSHAPDLTARLRHMHAGCTRAALHCSLYIAAGMLPDASVDSAARVPLHKALSEGAGACLAPACPPGAACVPVHTHFLPCSPPAGSPPPLAGAKLTGERRAVEKAEKSKVAFCRSLVGAKAQRAVRVACGRGSIGATPRVARPAAVKIPGAKRIKSSRKCVPSNKFRACGGHSGGDSPPAPPQRLKTIDVPRTTRRGAPRPKKYFLSRYS